MHGNDSLCRSILTSGVGAVVSIKGWHTLASVVVGGVARTPRQAKVVTALAGISRSCTQETGRRQSSSNSNPMVNETMLTERHFTHCEYERFRIKH